MAIISGWTIFAGGTNDKVGVNQTLNNSTGFNITPDAYRDMTGFGTPGQTGYVWLSNETSSVVARMYVTYYNSSKVIGGSAQKQFGLSVRYARVANSNDTTKPVISGNGAVFVDENQTDVATYTANESVTWSLSGFNSDLFEISSSGEVTFISAPDFENPQDGFGLNEYDFGVIATDSAGNVSDAFPVTVTVTDVDEDGPVIQGSRNSISSGEPNCCIYLLFKRRCNLDTFRA